jgi:hypothetical protein
MPRTLVWAISGITVWAVLQIAAVQWCTGWRDERCKYGFAAIGLPVWWLPNLAIGDTGASEVEQLVLIAGFSHRGGLLGRPLDFRFSEKRELKKPTTDS